MSLFEKLFRHKSKVRATPDQLGEVVCNAGVMKLKHDLESGFKEAGIISAFQKRMDTDEYDVEMMIFSMFAFDLIVHKTFGSHAQAIRVALRDYVKSRLIEYGATKLYCDAFEKLLEDRFRQYAQVWQSVSGGMGLQRLGTMAFNNIMGTSTADAHGAFLCVLQFTACLKAFSGIGNEYEIID